MRFPLKDLAGFAYTVTVAVFAALASSTGSPASAQTADDKRLFQEYLQLKAKMGTPTTECGPNADRTGTIVGRFIVAHQSQLLALIRIFPAGPNADAYLQALAGRATVSSAPVTAAAAIAAMQQSEATLLRVSAPYPTIRNAAATPDGRFTCRGLAAGRYVLMIQTTNLTGQTVQGINIPSNAYFVSEAVLPKEKPGYRYIATASAFHPLKP